MALHAKAKTEVGYRFYALYDKIYREDILEHAYAQCRSNKGAPGVDAQDFEDVEAYEHLEVLRVQLFRISDSMMIEPCFFLDNEFRPELVRPKSIEPLLSSYLNVRANTHRRFLRTELVERDCPPEIVDAFMGHWQQGEEPFGKYSSFSFSEYVSVLKHHLGPLLTEIGLGRSIQSRLAR